MSTAIVTGAYGAIGEAIARGLAEFSFRVLMVGRNAGTLNKAVSRVCQASGSSRVEPAVVDVSSRDDVERFARGFEGPLELLVNNAGTTPRRREETPAGIERQFATNVLGYYWMMEFFEPALQRAASARVVNVASYWAGDLDTGDLQFVRRRYDNDTAYRQSKQADRMLTAAFAEHWRDTNITVNACHPGDVNSKLSTNLGYGGSESPEQGAATPLWLATSPDVQGVSGAYFAHKRQQRCRFAEDRAGIERLLAAIRELSHAPAPTRDR